MKTTDFRKIKSYERSFVNCKEKIKWLIRNNNYMFSLVDTKKNRTTKLNRAKKI